MAERRNSLGPSRWRHLLRDLTTLDGTWQYVTAFSVSFWPWRRLRCLSFNLFLMRWNAFAFEFAICVCDLRVDQSDKWSRSFLFPLSTSPASASSSGKLLLFLLSRENTVTLRIFDLHVRRASIRQFPYGTNFEAGIGFLMFDAHRFAVEGDLVSVDVLCQQAVTKSLSWENSRQIRRNKSVIICHRPRRWEIRQCWICSISSF